jgi:hypothetical protein
MDGVCRSAADDRRGISNDGFYPSKGAHSTARHAERTNPFSSIESRPKSEKWTEGKSEENAIIG